MFPFNFLVWHYIKGGRQVFKAWGNFISFAFHLFSVPLLIKTLLAPWHRVEASSGAPGFSFSGFFEKLSFNLISRMIGFVVRLFFIGWGLLLALCFFVLGLPVVACWLILPPVTIFPFLRSKLLGQSDQDLIEGEANKFIRSRLGVKTKEELQKIPPADVVAVLEWYKHLKEVVAKKRRFWDKENLLRIPSLGTDLAFGYTPELDKYCQDLAFPPAFAHQLVGREKEIKQIESVLSRSAQANILLVGEPGTGKHTILLGLAKAIREKRVSPNLFYQRVLLLNMNFVLGGSVLSLQAKAKFDTLLKEAEAAGNVILVIDQIEKYLTSEEGVDLTPVLAQAAQSKRIHVIGITTPTAFAKSIFPNEQFVKYFEPIEVAAPDKKEALRILETVLADFERGKKVIVSYQALKEIIDQSDRLITHIPFPEKAIDVVDQLVNEAAGSKKTFITSQEVDTLIAQKTKVPVGGLTQDEATKLKNLDSILHTRVINQKDAVGALVGAMQRTRVGITETEKPIGSFLFLGPTGVGKTETAKALAEAYFGNEKLLVRFDMSQPFTLDLFIKEIRERPFGVLLLDEFEKAKPEVLHLFLTVFDEGYFKDSNGKLVSFKNMIIICTSNAGAEFIRERVASGLKSREIIDYILEKGLFTPELVNRFDDVIIFTPLSLEHAQAIAKLMLLKLTARLQKQGLSLQIDPQVYPSLAQWGYNPEFGARPMKRLISDKIENKIAQKILNEEVKKGDRLELLVDELKKEFTIKAVNEKTAS